MISENIIFSDFGAKKLPYSGMTCFNGSELDGKKSYFTLFLQ